MSLLNKVKEAAGQAATKAKEGVEDVQTKRELGQAYGDLGEKTFDLVDSGEITHSGLDEIVAKIRELRARGDDDNSGGASDGASADATPAAEAPAAEAAEPAEAEQPSS